MPTATIDDAHANLQAAGWPAGDIATLDLSGRRVRHVYTHRDEQQILARAPTRAKVWAAAWAKVWRQAEAVDSR